MSENSTATISIYRIDTSLFEGIVEISDIPNKIISVHNTSEKVSEYERFQEQEISADRIQSDKFNHHLYYGKKSRTPKWTGFVDSITKDDQEISNARNSYTSFVYFLVSKDTNNVFAITGGQGNFLVQNYIDDYFGLDLLSRLIGKDDRTINTLQERGLTGSLLSASKVFRSDASFLQEDDFGKLYKQVQAGLDPTKLNSLGINSKKNTSCLAKASFKINKSIDSSTFFTILSAVEDLLKQDANFSINNVREIKKSKEEALVNRLDQELAKNLKDAISNGSLNNFDFTHKDVEDFYNSSTYRIQKGSKRWEFEDPNVDHVFHIVTKEDLINVDADNLLSEFEKIKIQSLDADGQIKTKDNLLKHLHTEISLGGNQYIRIDGKWLQLTTEFIDELNSAAAATIKDIFDNTILSESWEQSESEDNYNLKYNGKQDTYVLHKIKSDNIELSDITIVSDNSTQLVHVKKGFDTSMRELCAQVRIAARYLNTRRNDMREVTKGIKETVSGLTSSSDAYFSSISQQQIPDTLLDGTNIFVLAILDTASPSRDLSADLGQFGSNIAKFELINLYRDLRAIGIELKLTQISKV